MATFSGNVNIAVNGTLTSASLDLGTATRNLAKSYRQNFANGTGIDQANAMFADARTVASEADDDLDLAGVLTDGLGNTITFTSIKGMIIKAAVANADALHITSPSANGFISYLGAAEQIIKLRPGGTFVLLNPEADGYAVTAGTGDLLRIDNQATAVSAYEIILIGEV